MHLIRAVPWVRPTGSLWEAGSDLLAKLSVYIGVAYKSMYQLPGVDKYSPSPRLMER